MTSVESHGAAIITPGPVRRFANTAAGVTQLVEWWDAQEQPQAICEATGGYELLLQLNAVARRGAPRQPDYQPIT